MLENQDATAVLEASQDASGDPRVAIEVTRYGDIEEKRLCFTVSGFDVDHPQYVYNILHVVGMQRVVKSASMFGKTGRVEVLLHPWQLVTEDTMAELARAIGHDALLIPTNQLDITIARPQ